MLKVMAILALAFGLITEAQAQTQAPRIASEDLMVPFHHAEWLASNIPGVVPHFLAGEGHLSVLVGRFGSMLDELLLHV